MSKKSEVSLSRFGELCGELQGKFQIIWKSLVSLMSGEIFEIILKHFKGFENFKANLRLF